MIHVMACVWIRIGIYEFDTGDSWFYNNAEMFETVKIDGLTEANNEVDEMKESEDFKIYMITWYFMCTTLT
jgi:hypothetical protein